MRVNDGRGTWTLSRRREPRETSNPKLVPRQRWPTSGCRNSLPVAAVGRGWTPHGGKEGACGHDPLFPGEGGRRGEERSQANAMSGHCELDFVTDQKS